MPCKKLNFNELNVGMELPEVKIDPITRVQLVDYASASGDYNLLHYDESFAKKTGLKGCIAHGMLQAGMISSYILNWAKGGILRNFKIRFSDIVNENDILTFKGKIVKKHQEYGENVIEINVVSKNQEERITSQGSAIICF
ncbi:MAG: MaoC family dehydratase N-terminal domain-containing protein [Candidatus Lokiarchaeota archaeon]|nr:MaoC family dehydratase N-terminal domain-containing protein [Candidatus Lokiarchaeota archaeon]